MSIDKIDYNDITFNITGVGWMNNLTGNLTPNKEHQESTKVYCLKDSKNGTWWAKTQTIGEYNEPHKDVYYRIIQAPRWYDREKGGYKRGVERNAFFKKLERDTIPKLVKVWEFSKGLKGSAKETWSDILESKHNISFKEYFEENHRIDPKMLEIEDVTDQDLFGDNVVQAWSIIEHFNNGEVQYYLSLDKDGKYFLCDMEGDEASPYYTEPFIKAVKNWEVKQGLKGSAKDTWEDIL